MHQLHHPCGWEGAFVDAFLGSCLLFAVAGPAIGQSFTYVHGGVARRVEATSDNHAWVTYGGGLMRYTTDGTSFQDANVPPDVRVVLRGMHFGTDNQGPFAYCVGDEGTLLFSTDPGHQVWTKLGVVRTSLTHLYNPNSPATLWDVWFSDRDHGWVVGFEHTILETSDGGLSWTDIAPLGHIAVDNPEWYQLHAFNNDEFIAVGDQGWMTRRMPGGGMHNIEIDQSMWCYLPQTSAPPWNMELWAVDFVGNDGIAVAGVVNNDGYVFRSADAGLTWVLDTACFEFVGGVAPGSTPPTLYGIELFGDAAAGAACGYGSGIFLGGPSSTAAAPPDCPGCPPGGKAWTQVVCDSDQNSAQDPEDDDAQPILHDIAAPPGSQVAFAVGDFGVVRRSDDGAQTWTELEGLHRGRVVCADFIDMNVGVSAGQPWRAYFTVNGGEDWSLDHQVQPPIDPLTGEAYGGDFVGAAMASSGRAVVAGDRGRLIVRNLAGQWLDRSIGTFANGPALTSAVVSADGLGMLVGGAAQAGSTSTLWFSIDGGATAFLPLQLTSGGVNVSAKIVDMAFDGTYLYYLTDLPAKGVYVALVSAPATAIAVVNVVGATAAMTCIGVRSPTDFYVGNAAGELFKIDVPTLTMQPVTLVSPADLGRYAFDCEPVPGSSAWWFTGNGGHVMQLDGTSTSTPKSKIGEPVVEAEFFSATEGLLIGRKHNVSRW